MYKATPYQYLLKGVDALVSHCHAVDLADFVADVKCGLSVDHAAVHDPGDDAAPVFRHLQCYPLQRQTNMSFDFIGRSLMRVRKLDIEPEAVSPSARPCSSETGRGERE